METGNNFLRQYSQYWREEWWVRILEKKGNKLTNTSTTERYFIMKLKRSIKKILKGKLYRYREAVELKRLLLQSLIKNFIIVILTLYVNTGTTMRYCNIQSRQRNHLTSYTVGSLLYYGCRLAEEVKDVMMEKKSRNSKLQTHSSIQPRANRGIMIKTNSVSLFIFFSSSTLSPLIQSYMHHVAFIHNMRVNYIQIKQTSCM